MLGHLEKKKKKNPAVRLRIWNTVLPPAGWTLLSQIRTFTGGLDAQTPSPFLTPSASMVRPPPLSTTLPLSLSTIKIELHARLLLTLKKAGVSYVRKSLVAKYTWMGRWMQTPANYFVFTGES